MFVWFEHSHAERIDKFNRAQRQSNMQNGRKGLRKAQQASWPGSYVAMSFKYRLPQVAKHNPPPLPLNCGFRCF